MLYLRDKLVNNKKDFESMTLKDVSVSLDTSALDSLRKFSLASTRLSDQLSETSELAIQALKSIQGTVSPIAESLSKLQQDYVSLMDVNINMGDSLAGNVDLRNSVVGFSSLIAESLGNYQEMLNAKVKLADTNFGGLFAQADLFKQSKSLFENYEDTIKLANTAIGSWNASFEKSAGSDLFSGKSLLDMALWTGDTVFIEPELTTTAYMVKLDFDEGRESQTYVVNRSFTGKESAELVGEVPASFEWSNGQTNVGEFYYNENYCDEVNPLKFYNIVDQIVENKSGAVITISMPEGYQWSEQVSYDGQIQDTRKDVFQISRKRNGKDISKYYDKKLETKKAFDAELAGLRGAKEIVRVPKITTINYDNLKIFTQDLKSPTLYEAFKEDNQNPNLGDKRILLLEELVEDISDICVEGTKKEILSYYGEMNHDKLKNWFDKGFSGLFIDDYSSAEQKKLVEYLESSANNFLGLIAGADKYYNKSPHPKNVLVTPEGLAHIDFESSCYTGMQNDLVIALEYEEMELSEAGKEYLLNKFIDYTNRDKIVIPSKEEFMLIYYATAFARNLRSTASRNKRAGKHLENMGILSEKGLGIEYLKELVGYNEQKKYAKQHLKQAMKNPLMDIISLNLKDPLLNLSQYLK